MRTAKAVVVAAATLLSFGPVAGAEDAKRDPSAFLGKALPDLVVRGGRWVKDDSPPARTDLAGKVVIVVTNSFL